MNVFYHLPFLARCCNTTKVVVEESLLNHCIVGASYPDVGVLLLVEKYMLISVGCGV